MTIARSTPRMYASLLIAGGVSAVAISLTAAHSVQRLLGFTFAGVKPSLGAAASIFLNNARLASVPLGFALILSLTRGSQGARGEWTLRAWRAAMDAIVAIGVLVNVVLVGASVGAYGGRMVRALLPHGPLEVLAFAAVLAAYTTARRERHCDWRAIVLTTVGCLATLAASAILETYVHL
jgi:hypothetical protein